MALYYFDIREGTEFVRDDEGSQHDSLDAAVQGAARSTAEVGTSRLMKGDLSNVVIEVRDEQRRPVCTVTASMKVDRHV